MRKLIPTLMLVFLSLYSLFIFPGCFDTPKEPVMPNWDVELNVPITEKEYKLSELLDTSKNIKVVNGQGLGDDLYVLLVDDIKNTFSVGDDITIENNMTPKNIDISGSSTEANPASNYIIYNPEPEQHLVSALFKSGSINLILNNSGSTSIRYKLVMPGFKQISDNSILVKEGTLEPNQINIPLDIPLQGYRYSELPVIPGLTDKVKYQYQEDQGFLIIASAVPVSGTVDVHFTSDVRNDRISINRLQGKLKPTVLPYNIRTINTSFGNDITQFTQVDFIDMTMTLNTRTFGEMKNIMVKLDSLSIIGYKKDKFGRKYSPVPLMLNQKEIFSLDFVAGADNPPTVFNKANSNLISFIQNLPQEIELRSRAVLSKDPAQPDSDQVISNRDSLSFVIGINAPLKITANNVTFQDTINIDDEMTTNDKDQIAKANQASVTLNIENHIPLGAIGKATFVDQYYNPLFSIRNKAGNAVSDQLVVEPAVVDNEGVPVTPSTGQLTLFLEKDDFLKFKQAKYILVDLHMNSYNNGTYVQIRAKDFIKVKLFGGVNYHVDPEDKNDEGGK